MPGRNGTGPVGYGSCPAPRNCGTGLGLACRHGVGRGHGYCTASAIEAPKELLQARKELLERRLDIINKQLENS